MRLPNQRTCPRTFEPSGVLRTDDLVSGSPRFPRTFPSVGRMSWFHRGVAACLSVLVTSAVAAGIAVPAAWADSPLDELQSRVSAALSTSTAQDIAFRVDVAGLGRFGVGSTTPQRPASTQKILTTTAALLALGPEYRYLNAVWSDGAALRKDGLLHGDLVLSCSGDPTLTSARLDGLAAALEKAGVRRVTGALYADDSLFDHDAVAPGWQPDFLGSESGQMSACAVDRDNWLDSDAFNRNPTPANLHLWRQTLARHHIVVVGPDLIGKAPHELTHQLATDSSAPLRDIVTWTLRHSDNFYAEMLLRAVGASASGHGSRASGIAALGALARKLHVPLGKIYDGSGLSYQDREAPTQLVSWLAATIDTPAGPVLHDAMPSSCQTGTLKHRLCGAWLTGRVHAKTGTLDGVRTLSGFTTTRSGRHVTFTILLSGIADMSSAMSAIDGAVTEMARFDGPPATADEDGAVASKPAAPATDKPKAAATGKPEGGALEPAVAGKPLASGSPSGGAGSSALPVAIAFLAGLGVATLRVGALRLLRRRSQAGG